MAPFNLATCNEVVGNLVGLGQKPLISWQHINLHGEYDFTKCVANDNPFDIQRISTLIAA